MRTKYYQADEFIRNTKPDPLSIVIDKKINLLKDFCILRDQDSREPALRRILERYSSEIAIGNAIKDLLADRKTLNQLLTEKGETI